MEKNALLEVVSILEHENISNVVFLLLNFNCKASSDIYETRSLKEHEAWIEVGCMLDGLSNLARYMLNE